VRFSLTILIVTVGLPLAGVKVVVIVNFIDFLRSTARLFLFILHVKGKLPAAVTTFDTLQSVIVFGFFFFLSLTRTVLAFFFGARIVATCVTLPGPGTLTEVTTVTDVFVMAEVTFTASNTLITASGLTDSALNTLIAENGLTEPEAGEPLEVPAALVAVAEKV
jgi:hypothetical protein